MKNKEQQAAVNYYFSLKKYFNQEAERLKEEAPEISKTVLLNNSTETKKLKVEDWNNELLTFTEADINKPAFAGKYDGDTLFNENQLQRISYKARDAKLKTRLINIYFDTATNEADIVEVVLETRNTLYHSTQNLRYEKNKSYSVSGTQEIRFLKKDIFKVSVKF
jgi:hypothetical protein